MNRKEPLYAQRRPRRWILASLSSTLIACPQLLDDGFSLADSRPGADAGLILTGSGGGGGRGPGEDPSPVDAGDPAPAIDAALPASDASVPGTNPADAGDAADASENADGSAPAPNCGDGLQNGNEQGLDCGGTCAACPVSALTHRYSFSGTGGTVVDTVGAASGSVINATLNGAGALSLSGGNTMVNLPNGVISTSRAATVEVWLTWHGGPSWQRVFDFGSSSASEDVPDYGQRYLAFTPRGNGDLMIVMYSLTGFGGETQLAGTSILPSNRLVHLAVVVDDVAVKLSLYLDGQLDSYLSLATNLTLINDVNNWLGQSQYAADPHLDADVTELRIYNRALDAAAIQASFAAGPDAANP